LSAEVLKTINSFQDDTEAAYDRVTTKLLKYFIELIIDPLVYIYNPSINQIVFPDNLKVAVINTFLKGGYSKNINNYRSISRLIHFSKILLLSKNQYGFIPGIGTEDALYSTI